MVATNFSHANLEYSDFGKNLLADANFSHANLTHAYFYEANMTRAIMTDAKFCHTRMPNGTINDSGC
jgi:uncharacterized protein YjbI with pentapeptide repeats